MNIYPVILSGGSGTRLWPLSRSRYPKQFVRHLDGGASSLLAATALRLRPGAGVAPPTLLCNDAHRFLAKDDLEEIGVTPRQIILEPVARNTAPAIAVAALSIRAEDENAVLVVMPSDHVIKDGAGFVAAVAQAAAVAAGRRLVLLGIVPTSPHTGYGYIQVGKALGGPDAGAYEVAAFHEKPDEATARGYLASKGCYWNSGIFVLHAGAFIDELATHAPDVLAAAEKALAGAATDLGFLRLDCPSLEASPSISVDYAVMEKAAKTGAAALIPMDVGWSDVGSWSALWDLAPHDADGNVVKGKGSGILEATRDTYVHSERALIATLGVDNLVIVDTPDALLVADKSRAQDVGRIVDRLKTEKRPEHAQHIREHRPWGYFEPLSIGTRFQVKLLHVKPGAKLSMQMHHHRSEHWIVVKGTALITIGDSEKLVTENGSVYIYATQWHRLENPGKVPLEIIEVQIGSYLGEDDIIRSDDVYNRPKKE
ncbi:MAG: mannose-1-phosphate guanylyltransferase/mannose-6-phosphate isomerase [Hyphomicrobiaceae bacterium]|nr:mannose-1-phosphate guanylyltransferase/mannose-6-phosphate isomerase [Hyphomicrobiaceae bacterium]